MNRAGRSVMRAWVNLGPRFLPFADAASADLPLSRLLRLSLFQVATGMAIVLMVGTLNRVMIVELDVPASLVGIMISLPLLAAPFRALIGFRSDHYRSPLGWRRVPFVYRGTMMQFGGLAFMPFALLVLAGAGQAAAAPQWIGLVAAALAFLLVGAGMHMVQTAGLALATDLAPVELHPRIVGLLYVMLLAGMMGSALLFGAMLETFSHARLIQVIQATAVATVLLNGIAVWKQEPRNAARGAVADPAPPSFREAWERFRRGHQVERRLAAVGLGTMAFSMSDVLLEPYGGQILQLSVADTTKLTAALALGGLFGFGWASRVLSRGADPLRIAGWGALLGLPAFLAVMVAAPVGSGLLFTFGTFIIGFGGGVFGHGTLTATMNNAPREQAGLALGSWGAVQATAAGLGMALGGVVRDVTLALQPTGRTATILAYDAVYATEIALLVATLAIMLPFLRRRAPGRSPAGGMAQTH